MRFSLLLPLFLLATSACTTNPEVDSRNLEQACASDADCSDGIFCNGIETCSPESLAADARGCSPQQAPCESSACNENDKTCLNEDGEACADADQDGHFAASCGGDDCDDDDANRFPGNPESCDDHDEDCNPETVGALDEDEDGFIASHCCNGSICGLDCDDSQPSIHRLASEVCDGLDNNCNGFVDEGVSVRAFPDLDYDGYGDASVEVEVLCSLPTGMVDRAGDCDDGNPLLSPREIDVCNGVDDDCDGETDEGTDLRCDFELPNSAGACFSADDALPTECSYLSCETGFWDCDGNPQNGCEANLCTDRFNCGTCGKEGVSCNQGNVSPPSIGLAEVQVELASGSSFENITLSPLDTCLPQGQVVPESGLTQVFSHAQFVLADSPNHVRTITHLNEDDITATRHIRLYSPEQIDGWAAAAGVTLDPKLGHMIIKTDMAAPYSLEGKDFERFFVDDVDGERIAILANIRPGVVIMKNRPGCTVTCSHRTQIVGREGSLESFVEAGTFTYLYFGICTMECKGG